MSDNRDFVYNIPGKVLFDSELKLIDLKVYMVVRSFMDTTGAAYPSNGWLADKLGISYKSASRSLNKLAKHKHITITEQQGRRYCIIGQPIPVDIVSSPGVDTHVQGGGHTCPGGVDTHVHQLDQRSITSKKINNVLSENDTKEIFSKLWDMYPLKKAKQKALEAFTKILKGKSKEEAEKLAMTIWRGLTACVEEHNAKTQLKEQGGDIWTPNLPHLSTWLNQHRWEDDYQQPCDILAAAKRKNTFGVDLASREKRLNNMMMEQ